MAYYLCIKCGYTTTELKSHSDDHDDHVPMWESCTCGNDKKPNKCELHPDQYAKDLSCRRGK
jgi:hypothetical protein